MSDGGVDGMFCAIMAAALSLTDLFDAADGLSLRDTGIGRFDVGFVGLGCLRDLLTNETARLLDSVFDQPQSLGH